MFNIVETLELVIVVVPLASDTGNSGAQTEFDWFSIDYEKNRMTDYQVFRLFLEGDYSQNEYRKAGTGWWIRNINSQNRFTYQSTGVLSGISANDSRIGVRLSV